MAEPKYTRTGHKVMRELYDVKLKKKLTVEVELVRLVNKRYAITGVNPETGMTMFKLISTKDAQEISGEVVI